MVPLSHVGRSSTRALSNLVLRLAVNAKNSPETGELAARVIDTVSKRRIGKEAEFGTSKYPSRTMSHVLARRPALQI